MFYNETDLDLVLNNLQRGDVNEKELRNQLIGNIGKATQLLRELDSLKKHSGFKYYIETLKAQLGFRLTEVLAKPSGFDKTAQNVYISGEIAGIKLALDFVGILEDGLKSSMGPEQHMLAEMEDNEDLPNLTDE